MEKYGELLRAILEKRGIKTPGQAEIFFNPEYVRDFHDPFLMKGMEMACVKIFETIEAGEKTIIYADYDCDGIPGAVILKDFFEKIGYKNFEVYIPERNSEGYGLNMAAIKEFGQKSVRLIITVDLGTTAIEEVAQAKIEGIDTIITDHHLPLVKDENGVSVYSLPPAYALLNPKAEKGVFYPEKNLSGAGVVFKLIQGLVAKYGEYYNIKDGWEKWLLDMAGISTLSDLVPLTGENRAIAYFGIKVLRKSPRPGLHKLLGLLNIDQRFLTEDDVTFMLSPRLNAASRMDSPIRAFDLLSTKDEKEGGQIAHLLSKINDERKTTVAAIMREINKKLGNETVRSKKDVIVIGNPLWRVGVLGLVAGKMLDLHRKPVFVWGKDENDFIKGSCRSDGSVSIVDLMSLNHDFFIDYGGHELAGGFTVYNEKIHFLEDALSITFSKIKRKTEEKEVACDAILDLSAVNMKNWKELERLSPFGLGNPKPVFFFPSVKVEEIKEFGKNGKEHLEISFSDRTGSHVKAVAFFSGRDSFGRPLEEGINVDLKASFDLSRFRGREELRLRIADII